MKKILISIIISIASGLLFVYLFNNLSPWDVEKVNEYINTFGITDGTDFSAFVQDSIRAGIIFDYLSLKNVVILHLAFIFSATSFLSAIHMFVDKLFFKKYYEPPNHALAIRRSIWIPIILIGINTTRLIGGFNILNGSIFVLLIVLFILIEYTLLNKKKASKAKVVDSDNNKDNDIISTSDQNNNND